MDRILVLNLTRMGDLLQSTPLISGLKARHPDAELGLLSQEAFASTARLLPGVDSVFSLHQDQAVGMLMDERQALGRQGAWFQEHLRPLRGAGWDLVFNLSHSRDSAVLARLLSRKEVRGIALNSSGHMGVAHEWARYFFCVTGNRAVNQLNLVDIYRRMGDLEGHEGGMAMKISARALKTVDAQRRAFAHGKPLVLVQAGASRENRRWPLDRMAGVMRALNDSASCVFALTGSGGEKDLCQALAVQVPDLPVLNLAGRTGVEDLGAWCRSADLLITNDTGTLHVAAANGLPSVSLFIATALPWETAPWLPGCLVLHAHMDCAPCSHHVVCPHVQCRDRIPLETVRDAALLLLSRKGLAEAPDREWAHRPGARVYETFKDEAGWLDLQVHGCPEEELSAMAGRAFRHLWLDRLERLSTKPQPLSEWGFKVPVGSKGLEALMKRLDEVRREAARARRLVEEVHRELAGVPGRASRLKTLARRLGETDDRLFELELGQPLLRPLGVLHRMAKEELHSLEDMETLGRATASCYAELEARCQALASLLLKGEFPQAGPGRGGRVEERTESCASL